MTLLQELVEGGASIGTVEAKLLLAPGTLSKWLRVGQAEARTPYRSLYVRYRSFAAEARAAAESQQLLKSPGTWIEKNTSSKLVEPPQEVQEQQLAIAGPIQNTNDLRLGANALLSALAILQESGVNIDEAIRKNQAQILLPVEKKEVS
jgi:stress response protein YsnF